MLNLIRMNTYRMLRTKSMLVVFLLLLLMSAFSTYMAVHVEEIEDQIQQEAAESNGSPLKIEVTQADEPIQSDFGISTGGTLIQNEGIQDFLPYFCMEISSGILLIFFTIAASLFISAEDKSGFVKNIAGQTTHKCYIYIAKIVPLCFYCIFCMIGYGLVQFCVLKYECGSELKFGMDQFTTAVQVIGIQLFLHLVFINGLGMLVTICKSTAVSITVGILCAFGFGSFVTNIINYVCYLKLDSWFVYHNIKFLGIHTQPADLLHALGVGILFFIVYNLIGTVWFVKKDIV